MEEYYLILIAAVTLVASYVQSVTGFGFGIVAMIFFPSILLYTEANVLSTFLSSATSVVMLISLFRRIDFKNLVFPLLGSFVANYVAVSFVKAAKSELLTLLLGIVLFALSIYFFFFSSRIRIRPSWYAGLIAGLLSGVLSGMFSIGGPPVVVYFMQSEKDTDAYLATISAYFMLSGAATVAMKTAAGFVTEKVLYSMALGLLVMLAGSFLGNRTQSKMKPQTIKRAVYAVMALSGITNVAGAIL